MPLYTARQHLVTRLLSRVQAIAQVQRFGSSPNGPTVCLGNVKVFTDGCPIVLDHAWVSYDVSHGWCMGQKVVFSAKVVSYERINRTISYGFSHVVPMDNFGDCRKVNLLLENSLCSAEEKP